MVLFNVMHGTLRSLGRSTKYESIKTTANVTLNLTRTRMKWASRTPVAIVNEDELYDNEDTTKKSYTASKRIKSTSIKKRGEISTVENKKRVTVFEYNDPTITSLMTKIRSRKRREKNDKIILEGYRLIKDALEAGAQLEIILFNNQFDIDKLNRIIPDDAQLYKVPYKTIQLWSTLTSPPGVMGIFKTPNVENNVTNSDLLPLTIICDNVRDPGNMGSIMRAAAGVGCEKLILVKGCVDLWEPKVLRTASGAHFRLPIHAFPSWDEVLPLINESSNIFVADSNFGDEFVPKYSTDMLQPSSGIFDVDPKELKLSTAKHDDDANKSIVSESNEAANKKTMRDLLLKLPIVPYYSMDYTKQEIVLVLSGETQGLSLDSYKLLNDRKAIRINIPLVNGVDSLNTGVALGIVTFEMKRQFIKKQAEL
ncbi:rRNA methyltransferase 3, mitochondrial [Megalopta genalis]|uniref:rRNA methyltransferase 3, mitochondrial n=1 Tax=Megalopta genalis TaxID=115081 RepID=UPI003FD69A13